MKSTIWGLSVLLLLFAALVATPIHSRADDKGETRLNIRLTGGAIDGVVPQGSASYRVRGKRSSFEAEANRVNLPNGTLLTVNVNGVAVGTFTLSLRKGRLELASQRSTVPVIKAGDAVTITNSSATILSGSF